MQLAAKLGPEGERFVLTTLLEIIELREFKDKPQLNLKITFLAELLKEYATGEAFLSYFPEVIISAVGEASRSGDYFSHLVMATKLPIGHQIAMALSLYLYDQRDVSDFGEQELERKLKELRTLGKKANELPDRVLD